jgi:hypothetical protein
MAKSIRKPYAVQCKELFPLLVAKFKERRLFDDLQTAFDHFMMCTVLTDFIEPI